MKTTAQAALGVILGFVCCWTVTAIGDWLHERHHMKTIRVAWGLTT